MAQTTTTNRKPLQGTKVGRVISDRRDKTRKVEATYLAKLPKYGKYVRRRTIYHVHDPGNESKAGDSVEVAPCRPISKTKSWRLVRVVEAAPADALARKQRQEGEAQ